MLAGLLAAYLIFSGGGGFAAKMFGKDTQALVRDVVPDQSRAAAAVQTLKQGTLIAVAHLINLRLNHGHVHDASCQHAH